MTDSKQRISKRKVVYALVSVVVAGYFAWRFQPRYHDNANALTVLVTVFSILAGFLVAVMAIVGSERALRGTGWKQNTYYLTQVKKDLRRHAILFYLYLVILALAFLASLGLKWPVPIQVGLECLLLFLACLAMLASFSLPGQLTQRHITDLENVIKDRREQEIRNRKP
ncbi:hypothetical protein [Pseudomonas aeruginosa]|uniref:hypothetical protein n=2 Tax=Pseudomonas aeruginosa TaxID=287 RepID=UPI000877A360|nr:hypothetical protein [Pseudomonas aeruginosa]